jgi:GST-like protein
MAIYKLYGAKGSGSAAIEAALEMTGEKFCLVDAASWDPASAVEELERINPLKQIPTLLLPDGSVLTESAAILLHLGLAHPSARILPVEPAARAQSIRGLVFIAANCYAAVGVADYPERWSDTSDKAVADRIRAGARARLRRYWEIFADTFPARPFFDGEAPGGLDLLACVVSKWSGTRMHVKTARPEFFATLERIERQPRIASVLARHWDT